MSDANDGLGVLETPEPRIVKFRGEAVEVRPLTMGQLPAFYRVGKPLAEQFFSDGFADLTPESLMEIVAGHADEVSELVGVAIGRDPEWLAGGTVMEFLELAAAVLKVNVDFFDRRLVPGARKRAANGTGQTRSRHWWRRATA